MSYGFLDIAVTPSVRAVQEQMGVAHIWQDFHGERAFDGFTDGKRRSLPSGIVFTWRRCQKRDGLMCSIGAAHEAS